MRQKGLPGCHGSNALAAWKTRQKLGGSYQSDNFYWYLLLSSILLINAESSWIGSMRKKKVFLLKIFFLSYDYRNDKQKGAKQRHLSKCSYSTHDLSFWSHCKCQSQLRWNFRPSAFNTGAMALLSCVPAGQEQTILFFFSFLFTAGRVFKKLQWPCALACPWLHYLSPSACDVSAGPTSAQDWHLSAAPSHLFVAPWFTPTGLTSSQITRLGWLSRANTCVWNYKRVIQNHYIVSYLN